MEQVEVKLMGTQTGQKKDKTAWYRADLYVEGVGAFDKSLTPAEYVALSKLPSGSTLVMGLRLSIEEKQIPNGRGGTFAVRVLGVRLGELALAENAKKAV